MNTFKNILVAVGFIGAVIGAGSCFDSDAMVTNTNSQAIEAVTETAPGDNILKDISIISNNSENTEEILLEEEETESQDIHQDQNKEVTDKSKWKKGKNADGSVDYYIEEDFENEVSIEETMEKHVEETSIDEEEESLNQEKEVAEEKAEENNKTEVQEAPKYEKKSEPAKEVVEAVPVEEPEEAPEEAEEIPVTLF